MNRMETKHEVQITLEEFKLIKQFYPDFHRKQSPSNDFIIGWSELMPVVEKIEGLGFDTTIYTKSFVVIKDGTVHQPFIDSGSKIAAVYEGVLSFIKWYSNQPQK